MTIFRGWRKKEDSGWPFRLGLAVPFRVFSWPFHLLGWGWPCCLWLVVGQLSVVTINNYKQNPYFYVNDGGGKKEDRGWPFGLGSALWVGVGPSFSWCEGWHFLLAVLVGPSFLGLGLAVPSFGQGLGLRGWPFSGWGLALRALFFFLKPIRK